MNVSLRERINARKLSFFCFYGAIIESLIVCTEAHENRSTGPVSDLFLEKFFAQKTHVIAWNELCDHILIVLEDNDRYEYLLTYCLEQFLSFKQEPTIDMTYCFAMRQGCIQRGKSMYATLNTYTKKLSIDHCDRIDQAIFLLGYVEYQTLKTPKNVLINEMIELSKRYSDPGGTKLINAVFDAWLKNL